MARIATLLSRHLGLGQSAVHTTLACPHLLVGRSSRGLKAPAAQFSNDDGIQEDTHALPEEKLAPNVAASDRWRTKLALGGLAGFSAIAFDVFHPSSWHLLRPVDLALHNFAHNLSPPLRLFLADIVLSDTFIAMAVFGWVVCTLLALKSRRSDAIATVVTAWAFYVWGAGPVQFDPFTVDILKNIFERERPSPMDPSFSFPSGHTSSVAFTMGGLLFVLLPVLLPKRIASKKTGEVVAPEEAEHRQPETGFAEGHMDKPPKNLRATADVGAGDRIPDWLYKAQNSWGLWALSTGTTAAGRVLADAHWFTDTMAATCLGSVILAALGGAVKYLVLAPKK